VSSAERFLLDTNVLSETGRKRPEPLVLDFLRPLHSSALYLSVLTLGEIRKGAFNVKDTDPIKSLRTFEWSEEVEASFAGRIFDVDLAVARLWGEFAAGRTRPVVDTLLAATAIVHGLTLVTRNVRDVDDLPVKLLNPWLS
jgi:predicted nucleic acid-binding protein